MKIQKHKSRTSKKGKPYYKWEIILPQEIVKKAGFKEGQELKAKAKKGEIRLKR